MAAPVVSMQQFIEAGAHFGHQTHRWNPQMKPYIFGDRNGVHILDLSQTVPLFARALDFVAATVAARRQGAVRRHQAPGAGADRRGRAPCGQHFVNHRWLGGMLTNWKTISGSIKRLKSARGAALGRHRRPDQEGSPSAHPRARQARAVARRHPRHGRHSRRDVRDRRQQGRAGDQGSQHARHPGRRDPRFQRRSPDGIAFPVPGNDDASRAMRLYCDAIADRGDARRPGGQRRTGADIGAMIEPPKEEALSAEPRRGYGRRGRNRMPNPAIRSRG